VTFPPLFILSLQFVVFVFFLTGLQQFIILDFVVVSKYFDPIQIKVSVLAFHSALNLLLNKDQIFFIKFYIFSNCEGFV
jgi:hypothetical protein